MVILNKIYTKTGDGGTTGLEHERQQRQLRIPLGTAGVVVLAQLIEHGDVGFCERPALYRQAPRTVLREKKRLSL